MWTCLDVWAAIQRRGAEYNYSPRHCLTERLRVQQALSISAPMSKTPKSTLIAATRNEGPFLLEWIAYHRMIGFTDIVLYGEDSIDGSPDLLRALHDHGVITYFDNTRMDDSQHKGHRTRAYQSAQSLPQVQDADWVMALDTDEFLNIHAGKGHLADLFKATEGADLISAAWRIFGASGIVDFDDALISTRFVQAAPVNVTVMERQYGLKTLFRPMVAAQIGPHRPALKDGTDVIWVNGSGADVTKALRNKGWSANSTTLGYDLVQINHYMIRGTATFALHNLQKPPLGSEPTPMRLADMTAFNANHATDTTITRHAAKLETDIDALRALPGVGVAHETCVTNFTGLLRTMRMVYEMDAQSDVAAALDAKTARDTVKDQQKWLADKQKPAKEQSKAPKTTVIDTDDMAPRWLADLRRSDYRRGWYHSDEKFAAQFTQRAGDTLIVSFDNLSNVSDPSLARETWGYGFYGAEGWSHLGVMAFEKNWYRDDALFDFMEEKQTLFQRFSRVIMTGTSMGAYAATAFADLAPGCTVVAFSPQATLKKSTVPWEERFNSGRKQDWSGRYAHGPDHCKQARDVFIVYDPYFEPDRLHAEFYRGDNVHHLKSWYSSHKSAQFMRRAEILKSVMQEAVAGTLTPALYYKLFRSRRDLIWYYNGLADHLIAKGHKRLASQLADHLVTLQKPGVARSIQGRL